MSKLIAGKKHPVSFTLNGRSVTVEAENRMLLSDLLRHECGATGTHVGCEHGVCGACTVQIDGVLARACLTMAAQAAGTTIRTVESLAEDPMELTPLQAAFKKYHGLQCGFCTPGILMSLDHLQTINPHAGKSEIEDYLSGHLCRCTGYASIVEAAISAFNEQMRGEDRNV
ncbi:(2Fe-2S)-binding protein [Pseudochrobactrum asaccharolyticum]|uniref:2-furoyl-CoA dehydrogenase 2Fe-2S iron sulfur subunit n=1 Tax=Pseudochrobactrum asaccharolyticum TaxID=354351 RepID=A0A366DLN1_9HYPH|nr:(2Fe-2S)-binding protein [Pseudochrobactrum asaccharolyticum]MBX8803164.1 (2Fe-2S)-binding protein [Ochrobactrum sp. MR28]MBX8818736.1 (2Fe-2S)-binding protein [Ochrobactrum sp. MR31]RBO90399.1 2-furoyl-CoA dehydrogenase 2Fe-2S iron sulfur subunit [Pseudochrobactrum asaccharolyticum]